MVDENTINRITMQHASSSLSTTEVETSQQSVFRYEDDMDGLFSRSDGSLGSDSVFPENEPFDNFHSAIDFSFNGFDDKVSNMENSSGSDTFHSIGQYSSAFNESQKSMGGARSFYGRSNSNISLPVSVCEEASEEVEESEDSSNFERSTTSVIIELPLKGVAEWNETAIQKKSFDGENDDSFEKCCRSISLSEGFLSRYKNDHNIDMISNAEQARIVSRNNLSHYESSATINFEDSRPILHDSSREFKMEYGVDSFKIRELESRMRDASRIPPATGSSCDCMHFFYSDVDDDEGDSPTSTRLPEDKMAESGNDTGDDLMFWITPQNRTKATPVEAEFKAICDIHPQHTIDTINKSTEACSGTATLSDTDENIMNESPTIENREINISSVAAILDEDFNKKAAMFESVCETLDTDISSSDSKSICSQTQSDVNGSETLPTNEQTDIDSLQSNVNRPQNNLRPFHTTDTRHLSRNARHDSNLSYNPIGDTKMSGIDGGNTDIEERKQLILPQEPLEPITTRKVDESISSLDDFQLRHDSQSTSKSENTTKDNTFIAKEDSSNSSSSGDNTSSLANKFSPSYHAHVPDSDYSENMTTVEDPMSLRIADLMRQIDSSMSESKKVSTSPLRCQFDLNNCKHSASTQERNDTSPETNPVIKSSSSRRVPRKCLDVAADGIINNRNSFTVSQLCETLSPVSRKENSKNTEGHASLAGFESALDFVSQDSSEKNYLSVVQSPIGLPKVPVMDKLCDNLIELDESLDVNSTSSEDSTDESESSSEGHEIPSSSSTPFIRQAAANIDATDSYSESMTESELDDVRSTSKRRKTMGGNTSSGFGSGAFESAVEFLGHESIAKYDLYEVLSPLKTKNKSSKFLQVKNHFPSISGRSPVRNKSYTRAKVSIPWSAIDEAPSGSSSSSSSNESTSDEESTCAPLSRQWLVSIDETENSESMAASELDGTGTIANRRRSIIGNTSSGMGSGGFESAVDLLGHESIAAYNLHEVLCPLKASKKSTKVSQSLQNKFEKLDSSSTHTIDFHSPRQGRKNSLSNGIKPSSVGNPLWNSNQLDDSYITCGESFLRRGSRSHQSKDNSQEMNNSNILIHDTFPIPPQRDLEEIEDIQPPRFSLFVPLSNFLSSVGSGLVSMRSSLARDSSSGTESIRKQPKDFRMKDLQRLKILGEGQFGQVWLVSDSQKNAYALKMFAKYDLVQEGEAQMILEEAKMHQLVHDHPFIVKLISVFQDDSLLYLLQQFAQGGELFSVIERYSEAHETELEGSIVGMPEYQAKFYTVCIADALRHMHSMDIAYRDLKPENCMIDKDGYPLLIDMGYAKHVPDKTFTFCGTPRFLPPEAINPDSTGYDWTADHWSLGILVYEMLSGGVNPFSYDGISEMELFTAVENGTYPSIDISPAAADLISGLLTVDPNKRLGAKQGIGTQAILDHAWLFDMHLPDLRLRIIEAPWKPPTKSALDTSCFDDWSDIEDRGSQKYPKLTKKEEALFESIEY